jgi:hypothetical protein
VFSDVVLQRAFLRVCCGPCEVVAWVVMQQSEPADVVVPVHLARKRVVEGETRILCPDLSI